MKLTLIGGCRKTPSMMKRTCSNCCAYEASENCCMNTIPDVSPGGGCELHETQEEFDADVSPALKHGGIVLRPPSSFWR
jgi:hypothetical protein